MRSTKPNKPGHRDGQVAGQPDAASWTSPDDMTAKAEGTPPLTLIGTVTGRLSPERSRVDSPTDQQN